MKRSALALVVTLAFTGSLALAACSDEVSSPDALSDASVLLLSHSPAQHRVTQTPLALIAAPPGYTGLESAAAEGTGGAVHLTANTSGSIPRFPDSFIASVAVFGYAWADLDTGEGIVSVIHPVIGRDSRQNPDGWHTHPVVLTGGTKPSGTSDFCIVSIGRSQGGIAILGDVMRVQMADRWAGVPASALDVAASFVVQGDGGCAATGLGVVLLDAATL